MTAGAVPDEERPATGSGAVPADGDALAPDEERPVDDTGGAELVPDDERPVPAGDEDDAEA